MLTLLIVMRSCPGSYVSQKGPNIFLVMDWTVLRVAGGMRADSGGEKYLSSRSDLWGCSGVSVGLVNAEAVRHLGFASVV